MLRAFSRKRDWISCVYLDNWRMNRRSRPIKNTGAETKAARMVRGSKKSSCRCPSFSLGAKRGERSGGGSAGESPVVKLISFVTVGRVWQITPRRRIRTKVPRADQGLGLRPVVTSHPPERKTAPPSTPGNTPGARKWCLARFADCVRVPHWSRAFYWLTTRVFQVSRC